MKRRFILGITASLFLLSSCEMSDCECASALRKAADSNGMADVHGVTSKQIGECTNRYVGKPSGPVFDNSRLDKAATLAEEKCGK